MSVDSKGSGRMFHPARGSRNPAHGRTTGPSIGFAIGGALTVLALAVAVTFDAGCVFAQDDDRTQTRTAKVRVQVPVDKVRVDDGDTVMIDWGGGDQETIRILGIDTPEIQHIPHNIPFDQAFGREASGFAKGAFLCATEIELLRSDTMDPYGRTLGYLFVNGKNYSALVVLAGLAAESVSHYGDNGFPDEAQAVLEAARSVGPPVFEPPYQFRRRMREVSDWMKAQGTWPADQD